MKHGGSISRVHYWQVLVSAWSRSGLTQREYCKRQGVSEWSFSFWKNRLARRAVDDIRFVPVTVEGGAASQAKEVSRQSTPLTLVIDSRYRVELGEGFSDETLSRLLGVLGRP